LPKSQLEAQGFYQRMTDEQFNYIVKQIQGFGEKLKIFRFVGTGEPLLHPQLHRMIKTVKSFDLAEKTHITTNGTLLTSDLSLRLINSGLDFVQISINGLSGDDYYENCGVRVDFKKLVEQIRFLYTNKKSMKINIKTFDSVVYDEDRKNKFYQIFGDISDNIAIERVLPIFEDVQFDEKVYQNAREFLLPRDKICSIHFYALTLALDGSVSFCCKFPQNFKKEDLPDFNYWKQSLSDIFHSTFRKKSMVAMLRFDHTGNDIWSACKTCSAFYFHHMPEQDKLETHAKQIYDRMLQ
jgi:MoaA/NifB/PqqE/SkfB family radical SAM enzyme